MSVGATTVLLPERPTPEAVFRTLKQRPADLLLRRADALCGDARRSGRARQRTARSACACASRPARRCPREVGQALEASGSASTFSTASARPRCCTSTSAIGRARSATARRASRCRATRCASSTSRAARSPTARSARCSVRGATAAEGYWNQREKSRAHLRGRMDAHRRQVHPRRRRLLSPTAGRTDDMFKVSGIWVSPFEVESALIAHARGARSRGRAEGGRRRAAEAEGVHRAEARRRWRQRPCGRAEGAREGAGRPVEISALDRVRRQPCRRPRPARSSASSCARPRGAAARLSEQPAAAIAKDARRVPVRSAAFATPTGL